MQRQIPQFGCTYDSYFRYMDIHGGSPPFTPPYPNQNQDKWKPILIILIPRIHDPIFMEIDGTVLIKKNVLYKGVKPLLWGLTIIERRWNSGNLPYSVSNTYGLNFIKIGGIWIFMGGFCPLYRLDFAFINRSWTCTVTFAISVASFYLKISFWVSCRPVKQDNSNNDNNNNNNNNNNMNKMANFSSV